MRTPGERERTEWWEIRTPTGIVASRRYYDHAVAVEDWRSMCKTFCYPYRLVHVVRTGKPYMRQS